MSKSFAEEFDAAKGTEKNNKLILGIISIVLGIVGIFFIGLPLGIAALIAGKFGIDKNPINKILGITGMLIGLVDIILVIIGIALTL